MAVFKAAAGGLNRPKGVKSARDAPAKPVNSTKGMQLLVGLGFFQGVRPVACFDAQILTLDNDTYLRLMC